MTDSDDIVNINNSNSSLFETLKNCVNFESTESLPREDFNDEFVSNVYDYCKMLSISSFSASSNISCSSFASDESFIDNILEEDGRISLAYENLQTIPKRVAEKFATQTKCLDLSYNKFQNLIFLSYFEDLHTLILDRNSTLDVRTLPFLPNLKILWINNCDISNISEWIQRIQVQCPVLEHLSIMGNPGINYPFNAPTLIESSPTDSGPRTPTITDYQEYILHMLPHLNILDGITRRTLSIRSQLLLFSSNTDDENSPTYDNSNSDIRLHNTSCNSTITSNNNCNDNSNEHILSTLNFRGIFKLTGRKYSYNSSSTN